MRSSPLPALRRWWATVALLSLLAAALVAAALPLVDRLPYLVAAVAAVVVALLGVWRLLDENRRPGESAPAPHPGLANEVTVARAAATALLVGFLAVPRPSGGAAWLPAILYLGVALGDAVDGWLARRSRFVTGLGMRLDIEVDAAALLVATLLAVQWGTLPGWVLAAGAARYAHVAASALARRFRRTGEEAPLPPSPRRRLRAGQQMGLVAVTLWPPVPVAASHLAALVVTVPFLVGFTRDALVVTGALRPSAPGYRRLRAATLFAVERAGPLAGRLAVAAGLVIAVAIGFAPAARFAATLAGWGWPAAEGLAAGAVLVLAVAALAVIVGLVPRSACLVLLTGFFLELQSAALDGPRALLLVAALWIVVFGPGPAAPWAPDEALLGPPRAPAKPA